MINTTIQQSKKIIASNINQGMIQTYWTIGKMIVKEEQKGKLTAIYGANLISKLSKRLSKEFGKGFNTTNISYMRQFYSTFPNFHAVRGNLSWTHYRLLLKVRDKAARDFYIQEAIDNFWSTRTLERQLIACILNDY